METTKILRTLLLTSLVLATTTACDPDPLAPDLVELQCPTDDAVRCMAHWGTTRAWSHVWRSDYVSEFPPVDPAGLWECDPTPPVHGCGVVDEQGHIGCWIYEGVWARIVAPSCAISGDIVETWPEWADCEQGEPVGMPIVCDDQYERCWTATEAATVVFPYCFS